MRIVSFVIALILCTGLLCGCESGETLALRSGHFEELEAKTVDPVWLNNRWISGETYCYNGDRYILKESDGELYLEDYEKEDSYVCYMDNRYLVGVDCGEFDGWVSICEYGINHIKDAKQERILNENCAGFFRKDDAYGDRKIYIFTGIAHMSTDVGNIYTLDNTEDSYKLEHYLTLPAAPEAILLDGEAFVVSTKKGLYSINADKVLTELYTADYWSDLQTNSIVKTENGYYIGTASGILEYRIKTDDIVWFPYYDDDGE